MSRVSIVTLRETIARIQAAGMSLAEEKRKMPLGHVAADAALNGGIVPGALHEIYAAERDSVSAFAFAAMLAERTACEHSYTLCVRQDFTGQQCGELSAQGLFDLGIDPDRLLFVKTRNATEALRAASDALACKALGAVVLEVWRQPKSLDLVASRKLTLHASSAGVSVFLIRVAAPDVMPSTAETRWFIRAARTPYFVEDWGNPLFEVTLARNRHGQTGTWAMEWSCDAHVFREIPQNFRTRIPTTRSGSHKAKPQTHWRSAG